MRRRGWTVSPMSGWPQPSTGLGETAGISRKTLVPYWPGVSERAPPAIMARISASEGLVIPARSAAY